MDSEKFMLQLIGAYGKTEDEIRQLNSAHTEWQKRHKDVKNARDLKKLIEYLGFFCEAVRSIEEDICKKTELNSDEATDVLTNILTGLAVYAKSIQDSCDYIRTSILDIETFENLILTLTTERDNLRIEKETIKDNATKIADLGEKYKALSKKQAEELETLGTERDNLSSDLETCKAEIETRNAEIEKLRSENAAFSDDIHDLGTKNGNLQAENAQLTDEVAALRAEIEKLRSEVELHRSESINLRLENGTFRTNNGKLYAENADLLSKISEQRAEIDRLHSELADIVPKYAKTGIQNDKLRSELAQITAERDEITEKYENSRTAAQRNWDKGKAAMAEARRLAREEGIHRKYTRHKPVYEDKYGKMVRKMYAVFGKSYREISEETGISQGAVARLLQAGGLTGDAKGKYVEYNGELVLRTEAPADFVAALTPKKRGRPRKNTGTAPAPAPVELQNPFNSDENPPIEGQLTFNPVNNK